MQNLRRPFLRRRAQLEPHRPAPEIEVQHPVRYLDRLQILERDLHPLLAPKQQEIRLEIRLARQCAPPIVHSAFQLLSHRLYSSIATASPNFAPKSRR